MTARSPCVQTCSRSNLNYSVPAAPEFPNSSTGTCREWRRRRPWKAVLTAVPADSSLVLYERPGMCGVRPAAIRSANDIAEGCGIIFCASGDVPSEGQGLLHDSRQRAGIDRWSQRANHRRLYPTLQRSQVPELDLTECPITISSFEITSLGFSWQGSGICIPGPPHDSRRGRRPRRTRSNRLARRAERQMTPIANPTCRELKRS
jgi:hypothetical protein